MPIPEHYSPEFKAFIAERLKRAKNKRGPGPLNRAANFIRAATRHVMHGLPVVSDEERERRLTICRACEWFIAETERCRKCGCRMRTKASWQQEHCPLTPPKW